MTEEPLNWWKGRPTLRLKRVFDVVGASAGILLGGPVIIATCCVLGARGSVLFSQERPGFKGRVFKIRKFRTMREPRTDEARYRTDADRVTKVGHFLRKTSIDELPELWNVLSGEMSLVGPRPLLVDYLDKYTTEESRRHEMPPGITGWAQVNGRQNIPFSERLKLDVWYVDNWSLLLDMKILFRTASAVFLDSHDAVESSGLDAVDDLGLSADRKRQVIE